MIDALLALFEVEHILLVLIDESGQVRFSLGKDQSYDEQRELEQQAAYLCTLVMDDNIDSNGIARYPVGSLPLIDPATGEVPIDSKGRRSYISSIAYGPSLGKNIGLGYLPADYCEEGREMLTDYLGEQFTVRVAAVGYKSLYDPENKLPKS